MGASVGAIREPPLPRTKGFAERSFFMLGFHHGFSGSLEQEVGTTESSADLASTLGFNLRGDTPIERYLVLGPLIQFGAWRADVSPAPSRNYYIDLALYVRARLPITTDSTNFQIWAGVPIGLTFDILGQDIPGVSDFGLGWNIGALVGGAVHFTPKFGMFAELGWLQHKMSHSADTTVYLRLAQWNLNLGFVFKE